MTSAVVLLVLAPVGVFVALFRHLPVALILVTAGRGSAVGADLLPSGWRPTPAWRRLSHPPPFSALIRSG
jgi:hypothetical protein